MAERPPYEEMLEKHLSTEVKILNAYLPKSQMPLSQLMHEKHPQVLCRDGHHHSFKKRELDYLADMTNIKEQERLLLPIFIWLTAIEQGEVNAVVRGIVAAKVISKILDLPIKDGQRDLIIPKHKLAVLRRRLTTTTQYVFAEILRKF